MQLTLDFARSQCAYRNGAAARFLAARNFLTELSHHLPTLGWLRYLRKSDFSARFHSGVTARQENVYLFIAGIPGWDLIWKTVSLKNVAKWLSSSISVSSDFKNAQNPRDKNSKLNQTYLKIQAFLLSFASCYGGRVLMSLTTEAAAAWTAPTLSVMCWPLFTGWIESFLCRICCVLSPAVELRT